LETYSEIKVMSLHFGDRGGFSGEGGYKNKKKGFLKGRF